MEKIKIFEDNIILMVILRSIEGNKVKFFGEILDSTNNKFKKYIGTNMETKYLKCNEFDYI